MDFHTLQTIRASLLQDLKEFVPEDHYSKYIQYGASQGGADFEIGRKFFSSDILAMMTARQAAASNVLITVSYYEMTEGEIAVCRSKILKSKHKDQEAEEGYRQLLSDKKHFESELCVLLEQYAQHLPDIESKAILFMIKDDMPQTEAKAEKIEAIKCTTIPMNVETIKDDLTSKPRKKLKAKVRDTNEGLLLLYEIFKFYDIIYLDQLPGPKAWGKIVSGEFKSDLIKCISDTKKNITLNGGKILDSEDFLEKYRKRFK